MGYDFDLVRVPRGLGLAERRAAVKRVLEQRERAGFDVDDHARRRELPPSAEQSRLADLLRTRYPQLRVGHESANSIELTNHLLSLQISVFDDAAGISMHPGGFSTAKYVEAARFAWGCLGLLEREGDFATRDPQIGRVLDLSTDFEAVLAMLAGEDAVEMYRASSDESYAEQLAIANMAGSAKPYSAKATFTAGELVAHPMFGIGVVRAVSKSRMTILFEQGTKILVCG